MDLHTISLCTGGGGLDIGLELAIPSAFPVVCVEREAFAIAHLVEAMQKGYLAQCPVWSDVKTFNGKPWRGLVDGLIGGIPCQPHSLAGRKKGQNDERDLWSPTRKIIAQARPWFVLIENVGGMLSPGNDDIAGAERVLRDLQRLGFEVEAGLFTASEVGAPHQRERIFILGLANTYSIYGRSESLWRWKREAEHARLASEYLADSNGRRYSNLQSSRTNASRSTMADSDSKRWQRRQSQKQKERERAWSGREERAMGNTDSARLQRRSERSVERSRERTAQSPVGKLGDSTRRNSTSARQSEASDTGTWQRQPGGSNLSLFPPRPGDTEAWKRILRKSPELEPAICGVADGMASRVDRLRMLGNGVVPLQAAYAIRTLVSRLAQRSSTAAALFLHMSE